MDRAHPVAVGFASLHTAIEIINTVFGQVDDFLKGPSP